jgi:hypothetical protein
LLAFLAAHPLASKLHLLFGTQRGPQVSRSSHEVAAEIQRYCAAHPGVRDTLEGIAWWLAIQRSSDTLEVLSAAVDSLVEQKVLEAHRLADGRQVFGCPRACSHE